MSELMWVWLSGFVIEYVSEWVEGHIKEGIQADSDFRAFPLLNYTTPTFLPKLYICGLNMTIRMIPIVFWKNVFYCFWFSGNPRGLKFFSKFKISNSISSVNSQYFWMGLVLNERYCNFAHSYCPSNVSLVPLFVLLRDSPVPWVKIKKSAAVVMCEIAISFI